MSKKRLNLTLDPDVLDRARRYSKRHQTSISRLVESFLATLPAQEAELDLTPTVQRLMGVAKGAPGREAYREHLLEKHGT